MGANQQWRNSLGIAERVFIRGVLRLETPAHFGNGDSEGMFDMPLAYDPVDLRPLLPGSSIAGALRGYLREYDLGFGVAEATKCKDKSRAERLFGYLDESTDNEASVGSRLIVDDSLGRFPDEGDGVEVRDGVAIDPKSRTAKIEDRKGFKFDFELLAAGTSFPISFELWLSEHERELLYGLAIALHGLEKGDIGLGTRKRRGFGQCRVSGWEVSRYRVDEVDGLLGWLSHRESGAGARGESILELLDVRPEKGHAGESFRMRATFRIVDSLMIGSEVTGEGDAPDVRHLHSWRDGALRPVLSGTSLAGVLRARALRIAKTLKGGKGAELVDGMFGRGDDLSAAGRNEPTGSRVFVRESVIHGGSTDRVQSRVKLDRFTGGAYPGVLFGEQPLFADGETAARVNVAIELRKHPTPKDATRFEAETGLLLLVLKDLWTGDLPLGGESGIGRGRLAGEKAELTLGSNTWIVEAETGGRLEFGGNGNITDLQDRFIYALDKWEAGS